MTRRAVAGGLGFAACCLLAAQADAGQRDPATLTVEPGTVQLQVGDRVKLRTTVSDAGGMVLDVPVLFLSVDRRGLRVSPDGTLEAVRAGDFQVIVMVPSADESEILLDQYVEVTVAPPAPMRIEIDPLPARLFAGTSISPHARVLDVQGGVRRDTQVKLVSGDESRAAVDDQGRVWLRAPGSVELLASVGKLERRFALVIEANPVVALRVTASATDVRTGDVVHFVAAALDATGSAVPDFPLRFATAGPLDGEEAAGAGAMVDDQGRFVAERPGRYEVIVSGGGRATSMSLAVAPRAIGRRLELVGRGIVRDQHTSDMWVWEAGDGRDYALTGTWGADGRALLWDVTDPAAIEHVDEIRLDARTINDVKVSVDGRLAVLSREGASNRRNGIVILDVSRPRDGLEVLAEYDEGLTGGVHNVFVSDDHVYALSAGQRYDIISIEDPTYPRRVGRFELATTRRAIHDVWVHDGVAYSSNWADGVVAVDVGGGGQGGSPREPVMLGSYAYPSGWNHAAFPYRSQSTGTRYVFAGDEHFPTGLDPTAGGAPTRAAGWVHVIEWEDWQAPREVARYEVPEAGAHNIWVEDDVMYVAYYNGGLRVVDVAGELLGDLYRQGREIARFIPDDPHGVVANAPFAWGPQPHKGVIFFSDWNSGLWAVRLRER